MSSNNNLKDLRIKAGLTQPGLAAICRETDRRIDVGMISRFENGVCLPTPAVAKAIANALQAPLDALYGVPEQMYIPAVLMADAPTEPESEDVTSLIDFLRHAHRPLTRADLCRKMDKSDRAVRRIVAEARMCGYIIIGGERRHSGYYLARDTADVERFFKKETSRALSILAGLKAARQKLREERMI